MTVNAMKTNEDKTVELEITVSAEDFGKAVDEAFKKNGKRMQIPGFRRGKAPRKLIEKMYGEGVFYEEAVNNTYPAAYEAAVEEKGIEPVGRAEIEVQEVTKDGYTFKATVAVKPEVTLHDYKGISVEKVIPEVTEEELDKEIDRRREQAGRLVTVEDRGAQEKDTAIIDFEGFVDDKPFEGGKAENYSIVIGSHMFIPGFEEQMIGVKPGDAFEVNVSFPEDYHAEELKGKPARFQCKLHELKCTELPVLDDEFAKDISEFDTLAELREDIKKKLMEKKEDQSQTEVENKLMETICNNMEADIPQCMFDSRVDEMIREFEYRLRGQGLDLENYLKYTGMELDSFRKTYEEQAKAQVETRLALEKIVELEKIEPSDEDVTAEYEKLAKEYGMDVEKVKTLLAEKNLRQNIAMNKAIDLVRENAKITEVKEASVSEAEEAKPKKAAKAKADDGEEKPKRTRAKKVKEDADAE